IGRLSGAKGAVWQYTAIDVASAHCWAELHLTPRNPSARWTSELARRVATDLASRGWRLEKVMSDNASEFRSEEFDRAVERVKASIFIHAGRPQTNGVVEWVQETILEECWKPALARSCGLIRSREDPANSHQSAQRHLGWLGPDRTLLHCRRPKCRRHRNRESIAF